jgi:hypothetical protein
MPKLCQITVPGLEVRTDWRLVHDRLLDEFPDVTDVLATTMPATILITYRRSVDPDAWLAVISETVEASRGVMGFGRAESHVERFPEESRLGYALGVASRRTPCGRLYAT